MVTLSNGKQVPWEEFSNWTPKKQQNAINPPAKGNRMTFEKCIEISKLQRSFYSNGDPRPRRTGSANKSSKSVMTPRGEFVNINAVASAYGVTREEICKWIKKDRPQEFYFSNKSQCAQKSPKKRRAVLTPNGYFPTMAAAALHFGVDYQTIKAWINGTGRHAGEFHFVESLAADIKCKNTKRVMTPQGEFDSLKSASATLGIDPSKLSRWVKRKKDDVYYLV
jgi:hypothetical protein